MTSETGFSSSVTPSSLQSSSSKSGQSAARLLSGAQEAKEEQQVTGVEGKDPSQQERTSANAMPRIEEEVQKLQEFSQLQGWTVNFSVERDLDKVIIKVVDADTRTVIRQIPSEELLSISKRLQTLRETDGERGSRSGLLLDNEI